jgi:hypothetical protein
MSLHGLKVYSLTRRSKPHRCPDSLSAAPHKALLRGAAMRPGMESAAGTGRDPDQACAELYTAPAVRRANARSAR